VACEATVVALRRIEEVSQLVTRRCEAASELFPLELAVSTWSGMMTYTVSSAHREQKLQIDRVLVEKNASLATCPFNTRIVQIYSEKFEIVSVHLARSAAASFPQQRLRSRTPRFGCAYTVFGETVIRGHRSSPEFQVPSSMLLLGCTDYLMGSILRRVPALLHP